MRYPSYPDMSDEDLIKYLDTWWKTASVKELIRRYKVVQDALEGRSDETCETAFTCRTCGTNRIVHLPGVGMR